MTICKANSLVLHSAFLRSRSVFLAPLTAPHCLAFTLDSLLTNIASHHNGQLRSGDVDGS